MFDRQTYVTIKSTLSFERNFAVTLAMMLIDLGLLMGGVALLNSQSAAAYVLSQVLFATLFFRNFCLVHEAGHGNCSSRPWLNTLTGHYASILCFMPFLPWKYFHQKHHVWTGNPGTDPSGKNVELWRERKHVPWLIRVAWRSWIPIAALSQHVVFWSYPLVLWREDRAKFGVGMLSVLLLPVSYALLYYAWPTVFRPASFAGAFVLYLFAEELVNLPHHADLYVFKERLPLWEQWKATRSCYYPPLVSEFFVLNFNFHVEHHLYPSLPWYRLRSARSLVRAALGPDYLEGVGISWNLAHRSRDIEHVIIGPPRRTRM